MFVVLEGPDGAGKSGAAASLVAALRAAGHEVTPTREPGGTPIGEALREVLLRAGVVERSGLADALLFSAARAELVQEVIRPALARGSIVVSDRYATSTTAYQGYGSGVPLDQLLLLERITTGGLRPDLVVLIDVPVEAGLARRGVAAGGETRFEEAFDREFHERVRDGYRAMAAADPTRWRVVDGTRSEADVARDVVAIVTSRLTAARTRASEVGRTG
ncbi:MAG: dTMP kinase [Chloroflexi bacterium]|nr:dTMP kinase [Chloroflexota bacterium]